MNLLLKPFSCLKSTPGQDQGSPKLKKSDLCQNTKLLQGVWFGIKKMENHRGGERKWQILPEGCHFLPYLSIQMLKIGDIKA